MTEVRVTGVEQLKALAKQLKAEADGKALRRDLIRELKAPLLPAIAEVRADLMAMGTHGHAGESLRAAVAKKIRPEVKLSGFRAGVRVRARKTPGVRGFKNAPQRLNRADGWRHMVFGNRDAWVTQRGKPGYFDDTLRGRRDEFRQAVIRTMDQAAERLAQRS